MNLTDLMTSILDHACPNGGGDNTYYLETHCVGWHITAHKDNGNGWVIDNVTSEAC